MLKYQSQFLLRLVLYVCFFSLPILSYAQHSKIRFENLSVRHGLSQSSALAMLQDKKGFLWIGTADGLNRYDGYKFKAYRKNIADSTTISSNYINTLAEDSNGKIWIGTRHGLYQFNWENETFTKYLTDSTADPNHILSLAIDKQDNIWMGTIVGLYKLDRKSNKITKMFPNKFDKFSISGSQFVQAICFDAKDNYLWLGTEYGLFRFDTQHNSYFHYTNIKENSKSLADNKISALYPDEYGNIWAGTHNGMICRWNRAVNEFMNIKLPIEQALPYGANRVKAFYKTKRGDFWVGTMATGLYLIKPTSSSNDEFQFTNFKQNPADMQSLSDNDIASLQEDNNENLWIGTFGGGINKYDMKQMLFNYYQHKLGNPQSLLKSGVRSILEDSNGNVWLGNTSEGLTKYDNTLNTIKQYKYEPGGQKTIGSNRINAVFEDSEGFIWIGASEGGVTRLEIIKDAKTGTEKDIFTQYLPDKNNKNSLVSNHVYVIKEDKEHYLWIGTLGGLSCLSPDRKTFKNYLQDLENPNNPNALSGKGIRAIFFDDKEDKIWIGSFDGGVSLFDRKTEKFIKYTKNSKSENSISDNAISSIYLDNYGTAWIGTFGAGLNKFDVHKNKITHINENDGLANDVVYGILEDGSNNLWLSTNRGISRYNIITQQILNYTVTDGLQSDEFNANAYHKGKKTGIFYFGGINGLTSFLPDSLQNSVRLYPVLLTDFRLFNKSVKPLEKTALQQSITEAQKITLSYQDYVFAFEFAALNLSMPHRVRYAYKLEGFDNDWIYTSSNERVAMYSNIPAGTYTFIVKATNSDGAWMEKTASILVVIEPPFWNTIWFRTLGLLFLIIGLLTIYQYRVKRLTDQQKYLEKEVKFRTAEITQQHEEILQQRDTISNQLNQLSEVLEKLQDSEHNLAELNAAKDKFFSILAHDLRSPLNSLSGFSSLLANFADEMSKEEIKQIAKDLEKNIKISTKYLENLLTWARSQMDNIEFKPEKLNLLQSVKTSVEFLSSNAANKQIALVMDIPENVSVFADANQLQTILTNLIANALKFTNEGGSVSIRANTYTDTHIRIAVADTGVGMSASVMDKIFRIDAKHSTKGTAGEAGTGLGLLLCKEFVEKNGGQISVESVEEQGTTFYFTLLIKGENLA
jgi:signal transduction histidine kinase/ligand-binding sensor domain-containing protein